MLLSHWQSYQMEFGARNSFALEELHEFPPIGKTIAACLWKVHLEELIWHQFFSANQLEVINPPTSFHATCSPLIAPLDPQLFVICRFSVLLLMGLLWCILVMPGGTACGTCISMRDMDRLSFVLNFAVCAVLTHSRNFPSFLSIFVFILDESQTHSTVNYMWVVYSWL